MTITQSTSAPLVVIGGATGNQGGSVLRHLQESDKEYRLRALTRDNTKPKAKKLADLGVDVVSIDLKPENKDRIQEAYAGADIVFGVTNFWEHVDAQREIDEGKAMIDAAIAAGVKLFIFSSLPSYMEKTNGKIHNVHHFESKYQVEAYGRSKASDTFQMAAVQAGWYHQNMLGGQQIKKQADGSWLFRLPISSDTVVPSVDIDEYGLWVRAVIEHKELRDDGRPVPTVGEHLSYRRMIELITKATGADVRIDDNLPFEEFIKTIPAGTPQHVIDDSGVDIWKALSEFGYYAGADTEWPLKYLAKQPSTFEEWLARTDLSEYRE